MFCESPAQKAWKRTAALETHTHPAFLGPVVSWLWSFLVFRAGLLNFLFEPCCLRTGVGLP